MRQARFSVLTSPILIGSITVLVVVVGVFLAYNANRGLPFVPTYDLKAEVPNAANLIAGNDVRIGGDRVGAVDKIKPIHRPDGSVAAIVSLKLQKKIQPLPTDSTVLIRPRSALGLKYVEITPGTSRQGLQPGATIPLANARPHPVEIDQVLNTFNAPTRRGAQESLRGFGDALAGRGEDLNRAIEALNPLLRHLEPVAANLAAPETRLARLFRALEAAAAEVAPVGRQQGELFVNLDRTFAALSRVARPFIQETISKSPPTEQTAITELPQQEPFLVNSTGFARELRPGAAVLPSTLPDLADAIEAGERTLPRTPALNRRLEGVFRALDRFTQDPLVKIGIDRLRETVSALRPLLAYITPAQTVCNYATLWFRNIASLLSEGDSNGTWQRFIIISAPSGPNNEGGPSSAPANGPSQANHLHSNPYPNAAAPGVTHECEGGNEPYYAGKTTIGNIPGNQGTRTSGQPRGSGG